MSFLHYLESRFAEQRIARLTRGSTIVGPERIQNPSAVAQRIENEHIPADVIECGVYNGGKTDILARSASRSRRPQTFWLFDAFRSMQSS